MFDVNTLNEFYVYVSAADGVGVTDFQNRLKTLFAMNRSAEDLNDYRLGKNPWKKLRDEITPVSHFLQYKRIKIGKIRFPLDSKTPDCLLLNDDGPDHGIEVTIERGHERYHLTTDLNKNGIGGGFIGIQDDASLDEFGKCMSQPREMYTSEQALEATKDGILRCLSKKDHCRYKEVFYLLIQADLFTLHQERWESLREELSNEATNLPFQEVYIIGNAGAEPWGFKVK